MKMNFNLEHRQQPLASPQKFWSRTLKFLGFSSVVIGFSLLLGMVGYHFLAGITWVDAFYNASMILTGMGPALDIEALPVECRSPVKIFAGSYAIYSGVVFLAATGLLLTPTIHRFFHKLHLDDSK